MQTINAIKRSLTQEINFRHLFLTVLLFGLFVLSPLLPTSVMDAAFVPTIILCSWLAGGRTRLGFIITIVVAVTVFGLMIVDIIDHQQFMELIREPLALVLHAIVIGLLFYCGGVIMRSLVKVKKVFLDEIIGTFNIYLIIGYLWSYVYVLIELIKPASFRPLIPEDSLGVHFLYFSFITLTTVGFGDTVPTTPLAQMFVILEAMLGQFYVAVIVAYLVSMYITQNLVAKDTTEDN
jgi:voltage-gated potassium channel